MSINPEINEIFKESLNKLNSMILYLDTQIGTVSLSKEEIDSINGIPHKHQPLENIDSSKSEKKESKKKEKKEDKKEEKQNKKEDKKEEKQNKKENKKNENNKEKNKENKEKNKENKEKIPGHQKKGMDIFDIFKLTDLRVGKVTSAKIMEGFNDVYELKIDIGEEQPRNIGTGLRNYVPIEKIQDSKVILFSNLKPKRFGKDFESHGMIMCAGKKDKDNNKETFELIRPNENAKIGEKVFIEGTELDSSVVPQISGGRFQKCINYFKTDENCFCMYNGKKIVTESGPIKVESLANCDIS